MNLEQFISECKINKQRKKDSTKRRQSTYESLHKEACLHASYGELYKPKWFFFWWKKCPVCNSLLNSTSSYFETNSNVMAYVEVYTCNECEYRYVHDTNLFGIELRTCQERE